jgi:hypothetical protein
MAVAVRRVVENGRLCPTPMTWSVVRGFGKVKYFNASYAILIAVPILAELHHKAVTASPTVAATLAFPVTLQWLYAASLSYAVGIALYQYFCPKTIKDYGTVEDYIAHAHEVFLRAHPQHRVDVVLTHLDPNIDSEIQQKIETLLGSRENAGAAERLAVQEELDKLIGSLHADAVQRFLAKDYQSQDRRAPVARWISFVLYVVGSGILVILLIRRSAHVFFMI